MPNELERYLVGPRQAPAAAELLGQVKAAIAAMPDAAVIRERETRLVVSMPRHSADALRAAFGDALIIEPDAPLTF